jgi:hypothetical protein
VYAGSNVAQVDERRKELTAISPDHLTTPRRRHFGRPLTKDQEYYGTAFVIEESPVTAQTI